MGPGKAGGAAAARAAGALTVAMLLSGCAWLSGGGEDASGDEGVLTPWAVPHGDDANTRRALDSPIDRTTVDDLEPVWDFEPPGSSAFGSIASEPLIADGTVYVQDLASNVFALDLDSGELIWEAMFRQAVVGPNGPALDAERVYAPVGNFTFVALDRETGEELWRRPFDTAVSQPTVVGDAVLATTSTWEYAGGNSGYAHALDVADGEERWRFQVVEEGFWGNEELNGGGGLWMPPAVDRERGQLYWGTGNPAPFPGTEEYPNGSSREEPNLYANSLIALDESSGELAWHDYVEPQDLFDHDFHGSPILLDDIEVDGRRRDVVLGSGKNGKVGAWDRQDGARLWLTEVGVHENAELTELPLGEPVEVYPGILGGVETPKAAAGGVVYVPVVNLPSIYEATGRGAETGQQAYASVRTPSPAEGDGELVAVELSSGKILWSTELGQPPFGGATVVNDLVFTATLDGTMLALDRETGAEVWRRQAPAGINGWPAVAGDTIVWPAGAGPEPRLVALRLGGDAAADEAPDAGDAAADEAAGGDGAAAGDGPGSEVDGGDGDGVTVRIATPSGSRFDRDTLTVPAGAEVTVVYDNASDIGHNIAFYAGEDADAPTIARTEVEVGPVVQELTFQAPDEPGAYHFQCDPHPTLMQGRLVVE